HRRGPRPQRPPREDVDGGQRGALAARSAAARPGAGAHTQLGLRREHAQRVAGELPVPVRPRADAGVGSVSGEAAHGGVWV
ncbi:hypothetical protein N0V87_010746, partial [Didymella glomerata]